MDAHRNSIWDVRLIIEDFKALKDNSALVFNQKGRPFCETFSIQDRCFSFVISENNVSAGLASRNIYRDLFVVNAPSDIYSGSGSGSVSGLLNGFPGLCQCSGIVVTAVDCNMAICMNNFEIT